ncbi:hypothetical protein QBC34DRAFT_389039 [Podospora aff. communis PSN243]|uniref:U3 small nucleolar RNA-associated protein 10 n=1 Tax=Podospora aff. communis PSN243 TaxID=3040156 RepID=A0AAV9H761_9PEZI|nr:hypothetical protein QBC34DRAFT_389039 [Podospora aff. communis PSN243]
MASSLAQQLAQVAAKSKTSLDAKTLKAAHAKSLIFEPRAAAGQTFPEIFAICHGGFEELCRLDSRFSHYGATLFSEQSQEADRVQMSAEENGTLDKRIEAFLHLVGGRLRLMPAIKAIEWLIRRFRIHEFNTAALLTTFLPYHTIPAFVTLMSILPSNIPLEYKFLDPYSRSLTALPRAAIVQQATNRPAFLSMISEYTLQSCRAKQEHPGLISFWGGIMAEAVNGMLDKMRSGRKSIQLQNDDTLLQQIGPVLSESLVMKNVPGLQIASYMVITIFASKATLEDNALTAFMDQLVLGWTNDTFRPGLVCLSILSQYRSAKQLSGRVAKAVLKVKDFVPTLRDISQNYRVDRLANGLALALAERLSKKGDVRSLQLINALLQDKFLEERQIKVVYKSLLVAAHKIGDEVDQDGHVRKELGSTLVNMSQAGGELGNVIRSTIQEVDFSIEELELKLETAIRPKLVIESPENDAEGDMDVDTPEVQQSFEAAFEKASELSTPKSSCLSTEPVDLFDELSAFFLSAAANGVDLQLFDEAPVLSRSAAPTKSFYLSFYMRIWSGHYPSLAKAAALDRVKTRLKEEDCAKKDFQAIIPYCITALSDPAKRVRRAAADLLTVLGQQFSAAPKAARSLWASKDLYGKASSRLVALEFDATSTLINSILLPSLEESVLHEDHVSAILVSSLEGSNEAKDTEKKQHISRSTRLAILKFLCSHVEATPLLAVKLGLMKPLNQIKSISGTSRTDLLLPVLSWWAQLPDSESKILANQESIDERAVNAACTNVVVANNAPGLDLFFSLLKEQHVAARANLVESIFTRVQKLWPSMKEEVQRSAAQKLFELSQVSPQASAEQVFVSAEAADVLRKVDLPTEVLLDFLDSIQDEVKTATEPPANKRRRVSTAEHPRNVLQGNEFKATLSKITFVLELVQEANPERRTPLLPSLFTMLSDLQHLRTLVGAELGYLQNLVLSSLLAMIPAYQKDKALTIDPSAGYGDILATCIQKSSSPTVINAALLLVASLARAAPDVVLNSVMPIFTFMGSSVLKQADDYSAHVVNQTVKEVIPPLIETFRKNPRTLVSSTAQLLSSFVTAYDHIPAPRKQDLFLSLVQNLGPDDFLFAVLAMFVDKYGATDNMVSFTTQLLGSFPVEVQLQTLIRYLDLTADIFKPKPSLSKSLLERNESTDRDATKIATKQLALLPHLLSNRRLKREINSLAEIDDMDSAKIRDLYATLLENLLGLATTVKSKKPLHNRCGDALSNLLDLLSISEFIKSVEALLDRPNVELRQKVLRSLELRVDKESNTDPKTRTALLAFLPQLTAVIRESEDINYKHTAVTCVDKIAEKYGKKDLEAVAAAASTIAGDHCLGQESESLRIMALLCLASLVDVLQDGIVPVLPVATPKALGYLEQSLRGETPNAALHNAACAFMTALAQHTPYMISGAFLDRMLACANASVVANLDAESHDNLFQCLEFLARLVDPKTLFVALERNWQKAYQSGVPALAQHLRVLGIALDKHSKATVAKNVSTLSVIFTNALDLRRQLAAEGEKRDVKLPELEGVESTINECALKMIYKLNDAAFRPIFSALVEWSTSALSKQDAAGKTMRQLSVYGFMHTFFSSLRSIVTSYASYIAEGAAKILAISDLKDAAQRELWKRVLRTLTQCFEHDQDGFWQAPAHFNMVAPVLVEQLLRAGTVDVMGELVPAVVELAAAADSKEHHKELNGTLLKHLRSEQATVRLAVVKCQQSLTERLGEEWLASLPEMLPYISELQDDDDEVVERENRRWIVGIEKALGESLDSMLQ